MKTLVLNAGYEPVSVISFRRAVVLVLSGKASVLAADTSFQVRSEHISMDLPAVIILSRYIHPPRHSQVSLSRRGVLRRDNHRCAYCAAPATTVDHVLPRSRGGQNTWDNLVASCRSCNNTKGDRTPEEMGWTLGFTPSAPQARLWWLQDIEHEAAEWKPFLEYSAAA